MGGEGATEEARGAAGGGRADVTMDDAKDVSWGGHGSFIGRREKFPVDVIARPWVRGLRRGEEKDAPRPTTSPVVRIEPEAISSQFRVDITSFLT